MISIRVIEIYDTSICRLLKLIFQSCLESGKFHIEWKKANVVPVHKKGAKNSINKLLINIVTSYRLSDL